MTIQSAHLNKQRSLLQIFSLLLCFCLVFCIMTCNIGIAFCEDGGGLSAVEEAVNSGASKVYSLIRAIVIPVVIVLVGAAGIMFLSGQPRATDQAKKIILYCFIGVAVVACAPLIGQEFGNWFKDTGTSDFSSYNPLA